MKSIFLKDMTMTISRRATRRAAAALGVLCSAALLGGITACNYDKVLTENPKSIIVPDNLYVDAAGFDAGLNALYAQVRRIRGGQDAGATNGLYATATTIGVDNGFGNQVAPTENLFQVFGTFNTPLNDFHDITSDIDAIMAEATAQGVGEVLWLTYRESPTYFLPDGQQGALF